MLQTKLLDRVVLIARKGEVAVGEDWYERFDAKGEIQGLMGTSVRIVSVYIRSDTNAPVYTVHGVAPEGSKLIEVPSFLIRLFGVSDENPNP